MPTRASAAQILRKCAPEITHLLFRRRHKTINSINMVDSLMASQSNMPATNGAPQAAYYGPPPPDFHHSNSGTFQAPLQVSVANNIPLGISTAAATPLPKPPKSRPVQQRSHQRRLPSPKRQRKTASVSSSSTSNPSVEVAVRNVSTAFEQNLEIARRIYRLFTTLHELGQNVRQKSAEVC